MAGLNSLMMGLGPLGLLGKAVGMIPGVGGSGGAKVPGPMSGIVPTQGIGGAIPGMLGGVTGMFMSNILAKKKKKTQTGQIPTATTVGPSELGTGRALTIGPSRLGTPSGAMPTRVGASTLGKPKAAYIGY